ncbi:SOS response-associated peptidase [Pseudomonas sp. LRF_L74]|uniref:SOS response-associated peptidase n=1 Tax=Pseudomonas sp. LRF_L74 TaxID=3369422 RepID=UPI003F5D9936
MSGRYALFRWSQAFAAIPGFPQGHLPQWNIAPGAQVLFQHHVDGETRLALGRWGLTPPWLRDLTTAPAHARSETLGGQPMFREAFRLRRCLLPANGFYEWRGTHRKRPFWMTGEGSLLYLAGLWEAYPVEGHVYLSVAMITQPAAHLRRPLLLDETAQHAWLAEDTPLGELQNLLIAPSVPLRERVLANLVNDPRCNGPECLTPA